MPGHCFAIRAWFCTVEISPPATSPQPPPATRNRLFNERYSLQHPWIRIASNTPATVRLILSHLHELLICRMQELALSQDDQPDDAALSAILPDDAALSAILQSAQPFFYYLFTNAQIGDPVSNADLALTTLWSIELSLLEQDHVTAAAEVHEFAFSLLQQVDTSWVGILEVASLVSSVVGRYLSSAAEDLSMSDNSI